MVGLIQILWCQVDISAEGNLRVELVAALAAQEGTQVAAMASKFPEWTSVAHAEAYHISWSLDRGEGSRTRTLS